MQTLKYTNMGLAFLVELGVLVGLCWWGFAVGLGIVAQIVLGIGLPVLAAAIWGRLGAPRSAHRLSGLPFLALRIIFYGVGCLAFFLVAPLWLAMLFTVLAVLNLVLMYGLKMDTKVDPANNLNR